ncbi:hypothetical protein [Rufibacter quisquiliarum]|uniref:Uncharacterized protein n=1 Tax=Rufibacter quisquiliarum TaxID=1549639 RepID=A0A839GNW4_9BACT|nr:hypothetical protein [Rufibacter quisquiliarum]MBA9076128.1 hypothetical protein [Rufibacter quisquiliarum]
MDYIPLILGILALLVAGFTFLKMGGALSRIRNLEKRNRKLEDEVKSLKEDARKGGRNQPQDGNRNARAGGQTTMPPGREPRPQQEPRQKQQREPQAPRGQQTGEGRPNQGQPQPSRQPQEGRARQEGQPQQQRQPKEPRPQQEPRQKQGQPQPQSGAPQQPQSAGAPQGKREPQPRRNENKRREPMNNLESDPTPTAKTTVGNDLVGDHLLQELSQEEAPTSPTRYAIIPEDGIVKSHQLQLRPDSDSYLEIDTPQDGSGSTRYRFNLSGNQAFVITQGMDRLENAFSFEKPSNRMVSQIVLQGDGVLVRTTNGWKIQEKAKIDFR